MIDGMHVAMVVIFNQQAQALFIVTEAILSAVTIWDRCLLLVGFKGHHHGSMCPFITVMSPSFYTIPIFHLLYTCYLSGFLDAYCIIYFSSSLRNILLPEAICCCLHTCCVNVVLLEMCYKPSMYANFHCCSC